MPRCTASREDGASRELRAYLRLEHNVEIGWLLCQIRHRQVPLGRRLLAWLRRRTSRAFATRPAVPPERRASGDDSPAVGSEPDTVLLEPQNESVSIDECNHEDLIALGSGGGTSYGQCAECGGVFLIREGRIWILRPKARSESVQESSASVRVPVEPHADRTKADALVEAEPSRPGSTCGPTGAQSAPVADVGDDRPDIREPASERDGVV